MATNHNKRTVVNVATDKTDILVSGNVAINKRHTGGNVATNKRKTEIPHIELIKCHVLCTIKSFNNHQQ